jgi:hypothetical protein
MKDLIKKIIGLFATKPPVVRNEKQFYKFRGRVFASDKETISKLNYALALNGSEERYRLVIKEPRKD